MNMNTTLSAPKYASRVEITNAFLRSVYNWMAIGLGITAVVSWVISSTSLSHALATPQGLIFAIICMVAELALVFYLSARINKLSGATATVLFLVYSALSGITLSLILLQYKQTSVAAAFLTTTGMFAAISLYGLTTKRDLAGVGSFCMMGLFGIIIASIVNWFIGSTMLEFGISCIGVLVFIGLTAYDTQYLKEMGANAPMDDAVAVRRGVILGALKLYLDFINLFIMMLRLMGDRR